MGKKQVYVLCIGASHYVSKLTLDFGSILHFVFAKFSGFVVLVYFYQVTKLIFDGLRQFICISRCEV